MSAIDHVERVFRERSREFNREDGRRKIPANVASDFRTTNLNTALLWLLTQCGSLDAQCRLKLQELLQTMITYSSFRNIKNLVDEFIKSFGSRKIHEVVFLHWDKNLNLVTIVNMKTYIKALDFCGWFLENKYLSWEVLFEKNGENSILDLLANFINRQVMGNIGNSVQETINTLQEQEELIALINKATWETIKFLAVFLNEQVT